MALTPTTDEKIALGLAVLRDLARRKKIPPPPYSLAEIAEVCGVSPSTILSLEKIGIAKAAAQFLRQPDLPPHLSKKLSRLLQP